MRRLDLVLRAAARLNGRILPRFGHDTYTDYSILFYSILFYYIYGLIKHLSQNNLFRGASSAKGPLVKRKVLFSGCTALAHFPAVDHLPDLCLGMVLPRWCDPCSLTEGLLLQP